MFNENVCHVSVQNYLLLTLYLTTESNLFKANAQKMLGYKAECLVVNTVLYYDCQTVLQMLYCVTHIFSCSDVNFIASPPSMVAAGSVVAAVQGLYLKTQDASLSSQNLTNFLSQVIRSDPVCKHMFYQTIDLLQSLIALNKCLAVRLCLLNIDCMLSGLLKGMSGTDRVSARIEPPAGSATQQHHGTQMC